MILLSIIFLILFSSSQTMATICFSPQLDLNLSQPLGSNDSVSLNLIVPFRVWTKKTLSSVNYVLITLLFQQASIYIFVDKTTEPDDSIVVGVDHGAYVSWWFDSPLHGNGNSNQQCVDISIVEKCTE
jgi:hypothetical protein